MVIRVCYVLDLQTVCIMMVNYNKINRFIISVELVTLSLSLDAPQPYEHLWSSSYYYEAKSTHYYLISNRIERIVWRTSSLLEVRFYFSDVELMNKSFSFSVS